VTRTGRTGLVPSGTLDFLRPTFGPGPARPHG